MSKNKEYAEKYAEFAMEQMRKYGIPASVTLAQGILTPMTSPTRSFAATTAWAILTSITPNSL